MKRQLNDSANLLRRPVESKTHCGHCACRTGCPKADIAHRLLNLPGIIWIAVKAVLRQLWRLHGRLHTTRIRTKPGGLGREVMQPRPERPLGGSEARSSLRAS
jgi:hypothetical protein